MKKILPLLIILVFIGAGCTEDNVIENDVQNEPLNIHVKEDTTMKEDIAVKEDTGMKEDTEGKEKNATQEGVFTKVYKNETYGIQFTYPDIYNGSEFCKLWDNNTEPNQSNTYQVADVRLGDDISLIISSIDATNIRGVIPESLATGLTIDTQEYTLTGDTDALHLTYKPRGLGQRLESYVMLKAGFLYNISRHASPESCAIQKLGDGGIESVYKDIISSIDFY